MCSRSHTRCPRPASESRQRLAVLSPRHQCCLRTRRSRARAVLRHPVPLAAYPALHAQTAQRARMRRRRGEAWLSAQAHLRLKSRQARVLRRRALLRPAKARWRAWERRRAPADAECCRERGARPLQQAPPCRPSSLRGDSRTQTGMSVVHDHVGIDVLRSHLIDTAAVYARRSAHCPAPLSHTLGTHLP
jgi:hypothetical protein